MIFCPKSLGFINVYTTVFLTIIIRNLHINKYVDSDLLPILSRMSYITVIEDCDIYAKLIKDLPPEGDKKGEDYLFNNPKKEREEKGKP